MTDRYSRGISVPDAKLLVDYALNSSFQAYHVRSDRAGDNICIFGFSRGAFTARALAGMLQKVGLLPQCNLEQLPFAYAMYQKDDEAGRTLSSQFKETFSICVRVKFLGVWYVIRPTDQSSISFASSHRDTVDSTGLFPKHLPLSGSNTAIDFFRHALALDERRVKFIPSFWTGETPTAKQLNSGEEIERVEEVFFAGAHCGKLPFSPLQSVRYLRISFQMSGVDL